MFIVETVLAVTDPTCPACIFTSDGLGVIESYDNKRRLDLLEGSFVGW